MKIVLLCNEQFNQVALANKVAQHFNLAGIVIEKPTPKKIRSFSSLINKALNRTVFSPIHQSWFGMLAFYKKKYSAFPSVDSITVTKINSEATINFIAKHQPDLVMVSGTSLIRKQLLELVLPKGMINLHTGLSPYIKGAPNCTNWCIAEKKFHLIGNTIMWLDAGIDSGDIITTALTSITGRETLLQLHINVMEHAHELYLEALKKIDTDLANCPRVKQSSIAEGTTYYNKQWNAKAKWALLRNFKRMKAYFSSSLYKEDVKAVQTVSL
ncbi:formyltransferase family protein [Ferruginibacter albus]|uniref:formyltransferase family protein n=1 Tax=Ferruginibacter albus TaxID=2875540 RepID=UPI001CC805E5|nr:formyltransferase family protein [Ferruginibacter albus]UAY52227.1 hypothetical protein K9M53_00700 [Ferruginibacter albus]